MTPQHAPYLKIVDHKGDRIPAAALASSYPLHEGAAMGRRMGLWGTSTAGPNASLFQSLNRLRSRSRELIRNNPLADGAVDSYVANIIGSGIAPRWRLEDKDLKAAIQELWLDWTEEADYNDELCDFYGLQTLVCRALIDAGEVIVRLISRSPYDGLAVPLQLQILESDHLDETYNSVAPNGNEIRMGIEIDEGGRRRAYWLFLDHPGESFITSRSSERIRIPAQEIIHVFKPLRAGQMRGRPWLSSIIAKIHELDQYDDAELVRKKTAAMFGGFIYEEMPVGSPESYFGRQLNAGRPEIVALEPGTFPVLPPGMKVEFSEPADVGGSYDVWLKHQLRDIARGMGVTYEQLTGDLTGVNYSSIRAGLLEFRRRIEQLQYQIIAHQFCRRVIHAWTDVAVAAGSVDIPDYSRNRRKYLRIEHRPDGWPWVDPVKDQVAEQMAVRNGFKSRAQVIAEQGGDIDIVDREIEEENARADDREFVFDTDPRRTAQSGVMQKVVDSAAKE